MAVQKQEILVVDDEQEVRALISDVLRDEGYTVKQASDGQSAVNVLNNSAPAVVLLDLWIGNNESAGMVILERIKEDYPYIPVIMISGHGTIDVAIDATRKGAHDFIEKPFVIDRLLLSVRRAVESYLLAEENFKLRKKVRQDNQLLGKSAEISQIKQTIKKVAGTNSRVFIIGPVGVETEAIAIETHNCSLRKNSPFILFNCANITSGVLEKELFGEENQNGEIIVRGAFDAAENGTIFLEEVTELPTELQSKLVRVLQENYYKRANGRHAIDVNFRIISSTSSDVEELITQGKFRQDLYYRLGIVPIRVPPIKNRREDIEYMASFFLKNSKDFFGLPSKRISREALSLLTSYDWPGNVRQLRNVIEWMLIMSGENDKEEISIESLPPDIKLPQYSSASDVSMDKFINLSLKDARDRFEREYLIMQINRFLGNVSKAANFIEMERSALHRKLRSLGISREEARE
ncbi:MAG: sigma-54 dependent transcriptional regulator [Holosporales bacterium]|jgi:two-component system nitrogen regulation response regulator NtrX|nr:sigma-54 dependent transcriptional regulator [Holosporales bacterium]